MFDFRVFIVFIVVTYVVAFHIFVLLSMLLSLFFLLASVVIVVSVMPSLICFHHCGDFICFVVCAGVFGRFVWC